MPAQTVTDKYRCHLPGYRRVRQYADPGVRLPASTVTGRIHAVASKLEPLHEALRNGILAGDYPQIDEAS